MSGGFVLSLDFELFWGVRDKRTITEYGGNILGARDVVPMLLSCFREYGIHATWAVVGFLLAENRDDILSNIPDVLPKYCNKNLSPYEYINSIGYNEEDDPFHYALSLVKMISQTPGQEIGTHTYSHFYCLEPEICLTAFRHDIERAKQLMKKRGIEDVKSIVFPRNQFSDNHLVICREMGLKVFRGNAKNKIYSASSEDKNTKLKRIFRLADSYINITGHHGFHPETESGMINIPASRFLRPYSEKLSFLENLKVRRILKSMEVCARRGDFFHLWFHPHNFGVNQKQNLAQLRRILEHAVKLNKHYDWPSMTMSEAAGV